MFCDRCGTQLHVPIMGSASYCSGCGRSLTPATPPAPTRVDGHVRLLGILWLAYGAFHISPGAAIWTFLRRGFLPHGVPDFVFGFFPFIGGLLMLMGIAGVIVGVGLLTRQSWARTAAIVVGAINLTSLPFGTALGIYTLWALLPAERERAYRTLSRAA